MPEATRPWWREPMMWLVVGGPAAVVLAGIVTMTLALRHVDPVLGVSKMPAPAAQASAPGSDARMIPAVQARNHAATPQR